MQVDEFFTSDAEASIGAACHVAMLKAADAKSKAFAAERLYKRKRDQVLLHVHGKTVSEKEAKARIHEEVVRAEDEWIAANTTFNIRQAEADGLRLRFEEWRTRNATTRAEMNLR